MTTFGLLEFGGAQIALGLDALREVVPRPAVFDPLPVKARGLLGAIVLRELVIPVVDVRVFVGLEQDHTDDQVIAILRHDGHLIGLLADGVRGLRDLDPEALLAMRPGPGGPLIFSGCFQPDDGEPLISVLDVRVVFGLPGVPAVREPEADPTAGSSDGETASAVHDASTERRVLMLVRCGNTPLALDVEHVRSVLPTVELATSVLQSELCHGVTDYLGVTVPVVDPLSLLGLGRFRRDDARQGIVLMTERGFVALLVTDIVEITQVPVASVRPLPRFGLPRPEYFAGVCDPGTGEHHLVLDTEVLRRDHELVVLGSLNLRPEEPAVADRDGASGERTAGGSYLVYSAGTDVVTPLADVAEILAMPQELLDTNRHDTGVLGLFSHRSRVLPVVDLRSLLGRGRDGGEITASGRVLIVGEPGAQMAFAVPLLHSIETSLWEEPAVPTAGTPPADVLTSTSLVRVPGLGAEESRLLPRVSLVELLATLAGESMADEPVGEATLDESELTSLTAA